MESGNGRRLQMSAVVAEGDEGVVSRQSRRRPFYQAGCVVYRRVDLLI